MTDLNYFTPAFSKEKKRVSGLIDVISHSDLNWTVRLLVRPEVTR